MIEDEIAQALAKREHGEHYEGYESSQRELSEFVMSVIGRVLAESDATLEQLREARKIDPETLNRPVDAPKGD